MKKILFLIAFLTLAFQYCYSQVTQVWVSRYDGNCNNIDHPEAIAVDRLGNVYVTGRTYICLQNDNYGTIKYNSSGTQQWVRTYNGTNNNYDQAFDIAVDSLGNSYVTGYAINTGTSRDITTMKYNTSGTQQWVQIYTGSGNTYDEGKSITVDKTGYLYVTGYSYGSGTGNDLVTIKYSTSGGQQWAAKYTSPGNFTDEASCVKVDNSGNVYITGFIYNSGANSDIITIKYNSAGVQQWAAVYNGASSGADEGKALTLDFIGNVFITGFTSGSGTNHDFVTIKYNSSGTQQWVTTYNGPGNGIDEANYISVNDSGNIFITGNSTGSGTGYDWATIKYNSSGTQQWVQRYNGTTGNNSDTPGGLVTDAWGCVYVTGISYTSTPNFMTIKYSPEGSIAWQIGYGGSGMDGADDIAIDSAGNIYVTGHYKAIDSLNNDYTTIKYSQPVNVQLISNEIPQEFTLHQNYPNPFNPSTKIRFSIPGTPLNPPFNKWAKSRSDGGFVKLIIYDILGREVTTLVNEHLNPGTYEVEWSACRSCGAGRDGSNYSSGIYYYKLNAGNYSETKKMVMTK